jgi:hypothetical protein
MVIFHHVINQIIQAAILVIIHELRVSCGVRLLSTILVNPEKHLCFGNVKAIAIYEQGNSELIHDKKSEEEGDGGKTFLLWK